jgi:lia operon protein LiaG
LILGLVVFVTTTTKGQEFKRTLKEPVNINIHSLYGELNIEGNPGNDLVITTEDYKNPPPRADGLKPIYYTGEDNSGIGLFVEEEGNQVTIVGASKQSQDAVYYLKVPENATLSIDLSSPFADDIEISNVKGELDVKSLNSDIMLLDITGPAVIHSISGTIEGNFSTISQVNPSSISSVSGEIDLALPEDGPANLVISTVTSEVYSNLDLEYEKEGEKNMIRIGGRTIKGKLGNGGVTLKLTSVSGEIYLRKK